MGVTVTRRAVVKLSCTGQNKTAVTAEVAEYAAGVDPSSVLLYDEGALINVYPIYGGNNYEKFYAQSIADLALGIKTMTGITDYTFTFSQVLGDVKMYDNVADSVINLATTTTYNFTAAANSTIDNRFTLYYNIPVPAVPGICHRYGKLQVSGSNGQNVVVKNMDDSATSIGTVAITADYQEIAVEGVLTPGQYKVEWNSQTLIIDVK